METLDLHVEHGVGVQLLPRLAIEMIGKGDLVVVLDAAEARQHIPIVREFGKLGKLHGVVAIACTDGLVKKLCQLGVGIAQPAAVSDAVGHVIKAFGVEAEEILENGILQDGGVQLGNAVDRVRADDGEISHAHLTVADDAHSRDPLPVAGEGLPCFAAEAFVDLLDDGVDAGELQAEQVLIPGLQSLGQNGVVGVGADAGDHVPGHVPGIEVFVNENTHQLGDAQGRMGIVEVDSHLLGQIIQGAINRHMVTDDGLDGCRAKEILLGQAEQLALGVVVGGVQHLGDGGGVGCLLLGTGILTLGKETHVEILNVAGAPQTESAHSLRICARDHHIVGNGLDLLGILVNDLTMPRGLPFLTDTAAEANLEGTVGSGHQPDLAAREPHVGKLDLKTVYDHLLEKTVFVAQGEARGWVVQRRQGVHEAGGETAETAVAKARVGLTGVKLIKIKAHTRKGLLISLIQAEIAEIGLQGATQKKLHTHIVNALGTGLIDLLFESAALFGKYVANGHSRGLIHLILGGLGGGAAEISGQLDVQSLFDLRRGGFYVGHESILISLFCGTIKPKTTDISYRKLWQYRVYYNTFHEKYPVGYLTNSLISCYKKHMFSTKNHQIIPLIERISFNLCILKKAPSCQNQQTPMRAAAGIGVCCGRLGDQPDLGVRISSFSPSGDTSSVPYPLSIQ